MAIAKNEKKPKKKDGQWPPENAIKKAVLSRKEYESVVALKMMRLGIRRLPVVDDDGKPVGLVSARDLVAVLDRASS